VKFAKEELGEADALYRNLGQCSLQQVPWTEGAFLDEKLQPLSQPPFDWSLSVMFCDLNNDGKPDLYVCNDFILPTKSGSTTGRAASRHRVAGIRQIPFSSMAVDVADVDGDGFADVFVCRDVEPGSAPTLVQRPNSLRRLHLPGAIENRPQYPRNMLFWNRGDGHLAEIAQYAGLEASEWSWTPLFLDVDLDGHPDLLVANGFARDSMNVDALEAAQRASQDSLSRLRQPSSDDGCFQGWPLPTAPFATLAV